MRSNNDGGTYLMLTLAMLFWGLSFIWVKQALPALTAVSIIVFRLSISSVLLFGFLKVARRIQNIKKTDVKYFIALAFFEPFVYFLCETSAMNYVTSSLASVIIATIPIVTSISAYLFFREKLKTGNYIGIVLSVIGVLLVASSESNEADTRLKGVALLFGSVLAAQGYVLLLKKLSGMYRASFIVLVQNTIGLIYFIPLYLVNPSWFTFKPIVNVIVPILLLSVFASTFAVIFFAAGVRTIGIARSNVFANIIPVFTMFFAYLMVGEKITIIRILGVLIVISGLILAQYNRKTHPEEVKKYA